MIINGSSRRNGAFFGRHLVRADHNEAVEVVEMRGLTATTIPGAFRELKAIASGTRCTNFFYHANLNTRADEQLTPEQWRLAADTLERELGLVDQPRFVVQHVKEGRTHQHVVWGRIDPFTMLAVPDSLTYARHERAARELEEIFGHEPVPSVLVKDRPTPRPERNPKDWESLRAVDSHIDPKAVKAELTALWNASDSGTAFAAALHDRGFILARGDRRDFVVIDAHGDEHSLARRLAGMKAAGVRERMADVDREALPSVAEGRELARARVDAAGGSGDSPAAGPEAAGGAPAEGEDGVFEWLHAQVVAQARGEPAEVLSAPTDDLAATSSEAHRQTIAQAAADLRAAEAEEAAVPARRFERVREWWGNFTDHLAGWRSQISDRVTAFRDRWKAGDGEGGDLLARDPVGQMQAPQFELSTRPVAQMAEPPVSPAGHDGMQAPDRSTPSLGPEL